MAKFRVGGHDFDDIVARYFDVAVEFVPIVGQVHDIGGVIGWGAGQPIDAEHHTATGEGGDFQKGAPAIIAFDCFHV